MIRLKQPSLAMHSHDVPGHKYEMQITKHLAAGISPSDIATLISWAVDETKEKFLHNLVLNCHGSPGQLFLGGDGNPTLNLFQISGFASLKGKIGRVWIVACNVGKSDAAGSFLDGPSFCSTLAQTLNCPVVASERKQHVNWFVQGFKPKNCIDRFEGKTLTFYPNGRSERFRSANYANAA